MSNINKYYITKEEVEEEMQDQDVGTIEVFGHPVTIVSVRMKNGFILTETTTCVDPKNYRQEYGEEICLEKIRDKVWTLLAFRLRDKMKEGEINK